MKSRYRILACDLDGTLIGWNRKINDRDLDAIHRARDAGIHVALCTGRNSRESAGIISALDLNGLGVFVNGGMVCHMANGSAAHSTYMPDALARDTIDFFGTRGHAVLVLGDDPITRMPTYCLTDHAPPHRATTDWLLYNRVQATQVAVLPAEFSGRIVRTGTVVNVDQAADLHAELVRLFGDRFASHSIYSPHYDCQVIELFHPDVNKWTGLVHLAEAMGLSGDEIVAVGDDVNDLPMLQNAPLSFAMGDAKPAIQKFAKRITGSHADCGVAQVVDALLSGALG